jgi:hypothetical protein
MLQILSKFGRCGWFLSSYGHFPGQDAAAVQYYFSLSLKNKDFRTVKIPIYTPLFIHVLPPLTFPSRDSLSYFCAQWLSLEEKYLRRSTQSQLGWPGVFLGYTNTSIRYLHFNIYFLKNYSYRSHKINKY